MDMNFFGADIEVFWDVTDFPIRSTDRSYLETLRSVLVINGYSGELKIRAYGEKKPDNLGDGVTFLLKRDKFSRLNRMLLDIGLWELALRWSLHPKNVMVIAENVERDTYFVPVSRNIRSPCNNCLWVLPDDYEDEEIKHVMLPTAKIIWKWQDLLAGKKPMPLEDVRTLGRKAPSEMPW